MVEEIFELGNTTKSRYLAVRVEAQANGKEVWINKRPTSDRQCSDWQRTLSDDEALTDFYSIISHEDRIVPDTIRKLDTLLTHMIATWLQLPSSGSHKKCKVTVRKVYIGNSKVSNTARDVHRGVKQASHVQEELFPLAIHN